MLLNNTLSRIVDTKLLTDYAEDPMDQEAKAVLGLAKAYREKAAHNPQYRTLPDDAVGGDLKTSIALMDEQDQVSMLYAFNAILNGAPQVGGSYIESPRDRDERKTKIWVIKGFIITFCASFLIFMTTIAVIGIRTGEITGGPVIDSFLSTAAEIAKAIWPPQTQPLKGP